MSRYDDLPPTSRAHNFIRSLMVAALALLGAGAALLPQDLPVAETQGAFAPFVERAASQLSRRVALDSPQPAFSFEAATEEIVAPIREANSAQSQELLNGVTRLLPTEHAVTLRTGSTGGLQSVTHGSTATTPAGTVQWGYRLRVDGSYRLRLRLAGLELPGGARMWVHGAEDEVVGPFGRELAGPDGVLWTPSVAGPEIALEVELPANAAGTPIAAALRVEGVMQLFQLDRERQPLLQVVGQNGEDLSCLLDGACFDDSDWAPMGLVKAATAHLQYVADGSSAICTGHLVNDQQSSFTPYMLTANHCFDTQASASSLESFFDYEAMSCGGNWPNLGSLPRVSGSTLLATSANNDMTFLRLSTSPSGNRGYLGWTTAAPANNSFLHRVSHPAGFAASYTRTRILANPQGTCQTLPASRYHYSETSDGATAGGSSGGAGLNDAGQIIGQLFGACGPDPGASCDPRNNTVDGKFALTLPQISQWLQNGGGGGGGGGDTCTPNLTNGVACLRNGRFRVTAEWTDFSNPPVTQPLILTPVEDINATGGFQNNPTGIQIVVRIADACSLTGTYWPWVGGFTGAGWNITFEDLATGKSRTFVRTRNGTDFPTTERDITTFNCN